jgi:hypothetical protein
LGRYHPHPDNPHNPKCTQHWVLNTTEGKDLDKIEDQTTLTAAGAPMQSQLDQLARGTLNMGQFDARVLSASSSGLAQPPPAGVAGAAVPKAPQPSPPEPKPKSKRPPLAKAKAVCDAKLVTAETATATLDDWCSQLERDVGQSRKMVVKLGGLDCASETVDKLEKVGAELEKAWQRMLEMNRAALQADGTRKVDVDALRKVINGTNPHVVDFMKYSKIAGNFLKSTDPKKAKGKDKDKDTKKDAEEAQEA